MTSNTALVSIHDLDSAERAGTLFRQALRQNPAARAIIKANPERALAVLSQGDAVLGLTPKGSADAVETIVAEVGDDLRMRELLAQYFTAERTQQLLAARGDLPAALANIASKEDLLAAIAYDIADLQRWGEKVSQIQISLMVRGWAYKLRDHSEYEDILQMEIGDRPFVHWVMLAIWNEVQEKPDSLEGGDDEPEEDEEDEEEEIQEDEEELLGDGTDNQAQRLQLFHDLGRNALDELNINPAEGFELCQQLLESGTLEQMDPHELLEARQAIGQRRAKQEQAATSLEEARQEATGLGKSLDL
jgi:hypothetical protein